MSVTAVVRAPPLLMTTVVAADIRHVQSGILPVHLRVGFLVVRYVRPGASAWSQAGPSRLNSVFFLGLRLFYFLRDLLKQFFHLDLFDGVLLGLVLHKFGHGTVKNDE